MSIETCIDQCQQCHTEVAQAAVRFLEAGAESPDPALVAALLDCSRITEATIDLLRRLPDLQTLAGRVCAEICERSVEACTPFQDNAELARCARASRACAEACRALAADGVAASVVTDVEPIPAEELEASEDDEESEVDNFGFIEAGMAELVRAGLPG